MIYELQLRHWKQLLNRATEFPGFVFRGQADYSWQLSTTIERQGKRFKKAERDLANREFWILTQFRRRAHNLLDKPPSYENAIEWLSLIQHYGGPTRLLDFTSSMYIALFFACEEGTEDAALWIMDYQDLLVHHVKWHNVDTIYEQQKRVSEFATKYIGLKTRKNGLLPVEPERLHERMSIHKGLFIMPININKTFLENAKSEYRWRSIRYKTITITKLMDILYDEPSPQIIKVRIKKTWQPTIIEFLDGMNVNSNTLFPGLDGFARSLRVHLVPTI